ncbi:MAG TPA: hypothetical protein VG938_04065 [Verrucomicrobiae bacterium]|jgi:hypothetical protein|nr:hypothetical protein [Verrucomicrobiae bacterium]
MAYSRSKKIPGFDPWAIAPRTCGPMGQDDAGEPFTSILGDTPGSLGINDWASPGEILKKIETQRTLGSTKPSVAVRDPNFAVSQGQVTFDAEGNDNPKSPYFSRQITWPGNTESGVTLGRGYDMGNRTTLEVTNDLVSAGLAGDKAAAFAQGAGKKGAVAGKFVTENREKLGLISPEVQKKLFEEIYPGYINRARANYDKWTANDLKRVQWVDLSSAIRDVLVDFVYQGFTKGPRPMEAGMNNSSKELIAYISSSPTMKSYESGRQRINYLKRYAI